MVEPDLLFEGIHAGLGGKRPEVFQGKSCQRCIKDRRVGLRGPVMAREGEIQRGITSGKATGLGNLTLAHARMLVDNVVISSLSMFMLWVL